MPLNPSMKVAQLLAYAEYFPPWERWLGSVWESWVKIGRWQKAGNKQYSSRLKNLFNTLPSNLFFVQSVVEENILFLPLQLPVAYKEIALTCEPWIPFPMYPGKNQFVGPER